ncbi:MAG TPA: hypothetical protein VJR23_08315 [Candidatus Acidoferrales bacterium]|nr:hypothetical protein [Candidatus Acidoferrales bacterium]
MGKGAPVIALLSIALVGLSAAQSHVQPTQLAAASTAKLTIPAFSPYGTGLCDGKGNLYFHVPLDSASLNEGTVLRLSKDESTPQVFRLPPDMRTMTAMEFFSVTPSGKVWFLDESLETPLMAFGFDSEGELDSQVKLEAPAHLSADAFSVSEPGAILWMGHFNADSPAELRGKRFAAIFEKSGKLRSQIQLDGLGDVDLKAIPSADGGTIAPGSDGNFYFLASSEVIVVSQSGEILRKMAFDRPDHDFFAHNLSESLGLISVEFHKLDKTGAIQIEFVVLDASTGTVFGAYTPPDDPGLPSCFSRTKGYIFLKGEDHKAELVIAPLQ